MMTDLPLSLLLALFLSFSTASVASLAPCSFGITAIGLSDGTVVENALGENQIGGSSPQGTYYFTTTDATLYDSFNRPCTVVSNTSQFQCSDGLVGQSRFSVSDEGNLLHAGDASWSACPVSGSSAQADYTVFGNTVASMTGCENVTLRVGGYNCTSPETTANSSPTSVAASSTLTAVHTAFVTSATAPPSILSATATSSNSASSQVTSTAVPTAACPTDLAGPFQFPHLIVPTSPEDPDYAFGDSYAAYISPVNSTVFNFDIPDQETYDGTCALLFLFPYGGATYFSGIEEEEGEHGGLTFAQLAEVADINTTYSTLGDVAYHYGLHEVEPGNNYTVATIPCGPGTRQSYLVGSVRDVELVFFQVYSANSMGLFLVPCASTES